MPRFLRRWIRRAYFAGPELGDAVEACQYFSEKGLSATAGYWPGNDDSPRSVADAYLAAIDAVAAHGLDCSISIKVMELDFAPDLLADITDRATSAAVGLHFDSRASELADQTFELVSECAQHELPIGCTLPGRWERSLDDAELAIKLGTNVRVVKGQWPDPHADIDPRQGYLDVIDRLSGRARQVGVATHDSWLAGKALHRLIKAGTPCELEQMFGLPTRQTISIARNLGVPIRMYIPYGNSWVPYVNAWVRKNPRVLWWIARDLLLGRWSHLIK